MARPAVIGAGLIVMGVLHVSGSGTWTVVAGVVLLALGGVALAVQRTRRNRRTTTDRR